MSRGLLRRRSVSLEGSRVPQSPAPSHQNPGTLHSFKRHAKCLCKSASLHCHACTSLQVLLTKSMRPLNQAAQFERLKAAGGSSTAVSLYTSLCLHARVSSESCSHVLRVEWLMGAWMCREVFGLRGVEMLLQGFSRGAWASGCES